MWGGGVAVGCWLLAVEGGRSFLWRLSSLDTRLVSLLIVSYLIR